jgi:hypothetical protein
MRNLLLNAILRALLTGIPGNPLPIYSFHSDRSSSAACHDRLGEKQPDLTGASRPKLAYEPNLRRKLPRNPLKPKT